MSKSASTAKAQATAERSSQEIDADLAKAISDRDSAAAEFDRLCSGAAAAALAGVEALRTHRREAEDAALRRDVAAARADDLMRQRDDAVGRELAAAALARYHAARAIEEKLREEIAVTYPKLAGALQDLLSRERALDLEIADINRAVPSGLALLDFVETPLRHEAAVESEYETVEVPVEANPYVLRSDGEPPPKTQKERRLVKAGHGAFRPKRLYECFILPGLRRDDVDFVVPGFGARRWW